jgi:membrane-associated PAP2 superfamily phosphatase
MRADRWWIAHAGIPLLLLPILFWLLHAGGGDRALADALYDAATRRWWLDPRDPASQLLYGAERALMIGAVLAGLGALAAGLWHRGARRWRRPVSFLLLCFAATTGLVSLGKHATNVDCPRALADYGGRYPAVGLLEGRPDGWARAQCFPAGHSSAGFAWVALYFAGGPRRRWAGLAAGLALGFAFAATQWARGMHFPSHDLVSAAVAWAVALGAYAGLYRGQLGDADAPAAD